MSDSEYAKRIEQIHWAMKFTGVIQVKAEHEEQLIEQDKKLYGYER